MKLGKLFPIIALSLVLFLIAFLTYRYFPRKLKPSPNPSEATIYLNQPLVYGPITIRLKSTKSETIDDLKTGKIWSAYVATVTVTRDGVENSHQVIKGNAINPTPYRILITDTTQDSIKVAITQN